MIVRGTHKAYMKVAIELAKEAGLKGEIPVGAIVVHAKGAIITQAINRVEELKDATAHAEILAIRQACKILNTKRLEQCDLYVTLEPCTMCAGAIAHARVRRVFFGAYDPKGGAIEHGACVFCLPTIHHRPEIIGGIDECICGDLLKDFFKQKRKNS